MKILPVYTVLPQVARPSVAMTLGTAYLDHYGVLVIRLDALPVNGVLRVPDLAQLLTASPEAALRETILTIQQEHGADAGISLHVGHEGAWSCWSMRDAAPGEPGSDVADHVGTGATLREALNDLMTSEEPQS